MLKPCPHRAYHPHRTPAPTCLVASKLAMVFATPTPEQCEACTNHPTLPQRINGIVCAVAKKAQVDVGLEPDPKLTICIHTEQTLEHSVLVFLQNKWRLLHSYKLANWNPTLARIEFEKWLEDIPQFGCSSCASHFDEIVEKFPPNFSSQESYFEWTVFVHNEVNETLYKDEYPLEKAKRDHGYL